MKTYQRSSYDFDGLGISHTLLSQTNIYFPCVQLSACRFVQNKVVIEARNVIDA